MFLCITASCQRLIQTFLLIMNMKLPPHVVLFNPVCGVYAAPAFTVISDCCFLGVYHSRQSTNKPDCCSQHQFSPDVIIPALSLCSCLFHIPALPLSWFHFLFPLPHPSDTSLCLFYILTSLNSPACLPAATAPGGFGGMIKWRWCALQLLFFSFSPTVAV